MAKQVAVAFHGIGSPGRQLEPGEARYWISRDGFLQFLDMVVEHADPSRILLTFDDANESDYSIALPALRERGLTGSFFIITDRLGRPGSLSMSQLSALSKEMEVGSHGMAHLDWRKQLPDRLEAELIGSKQILEGCIGRQVTAASIPFGRYNARVLSAAVRAGYARIFSSDGGTSQATDSLIGRANIRADASLRDFADLIRGRGSFGAITVRRLKALRRWFV